MKIDKELLMNYLIDSKENQYILNLYKIYSLSNKITNNDIYNGKNTLDKFEDKIYKVKEHVLSQKERIFFEFRRIVDQYSISDKKNRKINNELDSLITLIKQCDFNDNKKVLEIKEKISILEARMNISINYFYSASIAFLNNYNYINDKYLENNNNIDKNIKKEINKKCFINKEYKDIYDDEKVN